jgi:hypothetical protein
MSAFQLASKVDFLNQLNAANALSGAAALLATDFTYSVPKVVAGSWRGSNSDRNTAIRLTGNGTTYQGSQVILYNRRDLAQLANLPGLKLQAYNPASTKDLFANLKYYLGLTVDLTDIQDLPIVLNGDGSGIAQLTANPNSIGWQGSVAIPFTLGGIAIDQAASTTSLSGLNYPVDDGTASPTAATQGPMYLYAYDFTAYVNTLINYTPGTLTQAQADYLVAALKAVDVGQGKALWNDATDTVTNNAWNVLGATIVSNGLNDSSSMPTNPLYKYVLRLRLAAGITTPSGDLYLHYNDPFNPDDF